MKKYIIGILMLGALLFALCGCGGTPLSKAYDSLSALAEKGPAGEEGIDEANGSYLNNLWNVQYDEATETMLIDIDNGAELDPIFEALNKAIDGQDIGTLVFYLSGTKGDDYEKDLDKKLGELSCASMERLGLNYPILDYTTHNWLALADKTDKLYIASNCSVFWEYGEKDQEALSKFKDVQVAYGDSSLYLNGISKLSGIETFSFVPEYSIQNTDTEEKDPLDAVTKDNPYLNGDSSTTDGTDIAETETTEATDESGEPVPELASFDYFSSSDDGITDLANLDNLKTMLILPDTGYELTNGGQTFIKSMQYIKPNLQINAPGKAGTDNLVAVTEVATPDVTDETAAEILARFLKSDVDEVYDVCEKYKKADGKAVLNGKSLIYAADPSMEDWSEKKVYSGIGDVKILEPEKEGIKVPAAIGDYQTFVYIYPTYSRTGVYTSGTKAYSQTLHVQVFDMQNKVAYEAESVGTAAAPQSFSYFVGSVPDKHSGEVGLDKAYKYLKKLKTK